MDWNAKGGSQEIPGVTGKFGLGVQNEGGERLTEFCQEMDWLDLLAVQGILKSLFQHHNSKASIIWHSAFFVVQLSHPYVTTGKIIALTTWSFVSKVMSLLFNICCLGWS